MAEDLSLIFRVRGDASGAKQATAETRAAVGQLRSQIASDSKAIAAAGQVGAKGTQSLALSLQTVQTSLQSIGGPVGAFSGQIVNATSMLSGFSGEAAGLAGPAGLAVIAIGAMTAATVGLAKQIFDVTVQTADWQGKLFDLSQQTGVNVETLSALEILAKTTGGNIDAITASLGIFQKNLEDAQDPTSKEAELLKELGVETNNTEQALRQTLTALAAMPEGFQQTSRALELFGRGGKSILAILKEMDGDLDGAIQKFREMGILIDTDTAKAADQFNDQLALVQFQLRGVVGLIGNEAMPVILKAIQDVSRYLTDNRQVISGWVSDIGDAGRGALILGGYLRELGGIVTGLGNLPIPPILQILGSISGATGILKGLAQMGASSTGGPLDPREAIGNEWGKRPGPGLPRMPGPSGKTGGRSARDTSLQDATAEAALAERELRQKIDADVAENKRALEEQARDIEAFTARAIELAEQRHDAIIVRINKEIAALDAAYAKKLISQKEYNRRNRELDIENEEARRAKDDAVWEAENKRDKDRAAAEFAAHQRSAQMAEEASDRLIRIIQDRVDRQIISEAEGERQIATLIAQGFERRKKLLEDELTRITTSAERKAEINDLLIMLEGARADAAVQASQRIVDALKKEREEFEKRNREAFGVERPRRVGDATRPRQVEPQDRSAIDQLEEHFEILRAKNPDDAGLIAMQAGVVALTDAFQGLGQAIGSVVEAWVLYGSAGTSVRKVTAQILAGIAQQAAVKAIFELAEGFAALALAFFGMPNAGPSASAHFTAAAIYGSIAAVAAVAGRAVAGDAFKQQSSGGTSGGGGSRSGGGSSGESAKPGTTDVNRNAMAQPQTLTRTLEFRVKGDAVVQSFVEDYNFNGRTRVVIKSDGQG